MPATDDAALARLLDAYAEAAAHPILDSFRGRVRDREHAARATLLAHLDAHYARRAPLAEIAARYAKWYADDGDEANAALDDIDRIARAALGDQP